MGIVDRIRSAIGADTQRAWKGSTQAIATDAVSHPHAGLFPVGMFPESRSAAGERRRERDEDQEIVADIERRWSDNRPGDPYDRRGDREAEWQEWLARREAKLKEVENHPLISQARVLAVQFREAEPWYWCRSDDGSQYPAPSRSRDSDVIERVTAEILSIRDRLASEFEPDPVERALTSAVLDELRADWEFEHGTDCDGCSFYEPAGRRGDGLIRQIESATRLQKLSALSERELSAYKRVTEARRDNDWMGDCHDSARQKSRILDDIAAVEKNRAQLTCREMTEQDQIGAQEVERANRGFEIGM